MSESNLLKITQSQKEVFEAMGIVIDETDFCNCEYVQIKCRFSCAGCHFKGIDNQCNNLYCPEGSTWGEIVESISK